MIKAFKYFGILSVALMSPSLVFAESAPTWTWSAGLQTYYYRDNDGRVHYGDGSVSQPSTVWFDSTGKAVYAANSAGPADQTGQYAYKAPAVSGSPGAVPAPPPQAVVKNPGGAVFGGTATAGSSTKATSSTTPKTTAASPFKGTDSSLWQSSGNGYYYRDNDGRVHYSDGSVSGPNQTWTDSTGKTVYAANSAGPADKTGQYAYQQPRIDDSNVGPPPAAPIKTAVTNPGGAVFGGTQTATVSPGKMAEATSAVKAAESSKASGATADGASAKKWTTE